MTIKNVPLMAVCKLPKVPGIYIVYLDNRVLYVGKAKNIFQRWQTHHRYLQLERDFPDCRITWLEVPLELLDVQERAMIAKLKPVLNNTKVEREKPRLTVPFLGTYFDEMLKVDAALCGAKVSSHATALLEEVLTEETPRLKSQVQYIADRDGKPYDEVWKALRDGTYEDTNGTSISDE